MSRQEKKKLIGSTPASTAVHAYSTYTKQASSIRQKHVIIPRTNIPENCNTYIPGNDLSWKSLCTQRLELEISWAFFFHSKMQISRPNKKLHSYEIGTTGPLGPKLKARVLTPRVGRIMSVSRTAGGVEIERAFLNCLIIV